MIDQPKELAMKEIRSTTATEIRTLTSVPFFRTIVNVVDVTICRRMDAIESNDFPIPIHNTSTMGKSLEMPGRITLDNLTKKEQGLRPSILLWIVRVTVNAMIEIRRQLILATDKIVFVFFRLVVAAQHEHRFKHQHGLPFEFPSVHQYVPMRPPLGMYPSGSNPRPMLQYLRREQLQQHSWNLSK
jgi:hypothetical protein